MPWRDRLTLGLGLPLLSLGALGVTTQARAAQAAAVVPDYPPAEPAAVDRPVVQPDRYGVRSPLLPP